MPTRKPVPAILPWLTALAAAPFVLIVAAVTATRFGGLDLAIGYDLLTWTVARLLAWVGLAAALAASLSVLAHLIKLVEDGAATSDEAPGLSAQFRLA